MPWRGAVSRRIHLTPSPPPHLGPQVAEKQLWEATRNRDRVSEILGLYMRNRQALEDALDVEDAGED